MPGLTDWQSRMPFALPPNRSQQASTLTELGYGHPHILDYAHGRIPRDEMVSTYGPDEVLKLDSELRRIMSEPTGMKKHLVNQRYLRTIPKGIGNLIKSEIKGYSDIEDRDFHANLSPDVPKMVEKEVRPSNFNLLELGKDVGRLAGRVGVGIAQDLAGRAKAGGQLITGGGREDAKRAYEETVATPWVDFGQTRHGGGKALEKGLDYLGSGIEWLENKAKRGLVAGGVSPEHAEDALAAANTLLAIAPMAKMGHGMLFSKKGIVRSAKKAPTVNKAPLETMNQVAATNTLPDLFKLPVGHPREAISPPMLKSPSPNPVKKFFSPMSELPGAPDYLLSRNVGRGVIGKGSELAAEYVKELEGLPVESRKNIFRALDAGGGSAEGLSDVEQATLGKLTNLNNTIGQSMVERGYLDPTEFKELEGRYATRRYAMFTDKETSNPAVGVDTDVFKERAKMTPEQRRALGLVEDIAPVQEGYLKTSLENLGKDIHMRNVAENPEWTWRPKKVSVFGQDIPVAELDNQIGLQKKIVQQMPSDDASARLAALEKAREANPSAPGKDFIKVPDMEKWGPLRNAYVRRPIYEDLNNFIPTVERSTGVRAGVGEKIRRFAEGSIGTFKIAKTALNIPSWARNAYEGWVRMDLSGIPLGQIPFYYGKAISSLLRKDKDYRLAQAGGLFEGGFDASDLRPALKILQDTVPATTSKEGWIGDLANMGLRAAKAVSIYGGKAVDAMSKGYQATDNVAKHAMFLANRSAGLDNADAILRATKWGMDYSDVNPTIRSSRKFWLPFVTYNYKMTPLLAEVAAERPWKFAKYAAAPEMFNEAVRRASGNFSQQEVDDLINIYPAEAEKQGTPYLLPTRSPGGKIRFISPDYFMPWGNFLSTARGVASGDLREASRFISMGNPIMDVYSTIQASRGEPLEDLFTGKKLYNPLDSTMSKVYKLSSQLLSNIAVPSAFLPGGAVDIARNVVKRDSKKDKSWDDVVLSLMGIKTRTLDPVQLEMMRTRAIGKLDAAWRDYNDNSSDSRAVRQKKFDEYFALRASLEPDIRKGVMNNGGREDGSFNIPAVY